MTSDATDYVRQGALIALAMVMVQVGAIALASVYLANPVHCRADRVLPEPDEFAHASSDGLCRPIAWLCDRWPKAPTPRSRRCGS